MNFQMINFAMKLGCQIDGADEGINTLVSSSWLEKNMVEVINVPIVHSPSQIIDGDITIMNAANNHQNIVSHCLENHVFACSFGGDHTCGIGGPSAALEYYKDDVTIIWLDAHADSHNLQTSPSKHIHGMPCAILQGMCEEPLKLSTYLLQPERLVYVGLNSYEKEEIDHINKNHIAALFAKSIRNQDINTTLEWIRSSIKTKHVYLSFDLDVLSKDEFFSVNVNHDEIYSNSLGLTLLQVHAIIEMLFKEYSFVGCDLVEYNPRLDKNHSDFNKVIKTLDLLLKHVKENEHDKKII
jgi:arginase